MAINEHCLTKCNSNKDFSDNLGIVPRPSFPDETQGHCPQFPTATALNCFKEKVELTSLKGLRIAHKTK